MGKNRRVPYHGMKTRTVRFWTQFWTGDRTIPLTFEDQGLLSTVTLDYFTGAKGHLELASLLSKVGIFLGSIPPK